MQFGPRARIVLLVAGPAALGLVAAHAPLVVWVMTSLAALLAAWFLAAGFTTQLRASEIAAAQPIQQLSQRVDALTTDRARTEAMLSGMVEGVLVVDAAGRLQLINEAARRMLYLDAIAVGNHYVAAVRHPGIVQQLGAALRGEQQDPIEVPIADRIFSAQATPAGGARAGGGGAVLVLHDITELRRADRVRQDFVANVSHELRTPLTAVRGYVEALSEEPVSPEDRAKFLEVIDRQTARMERLVRDLLRLARLDAQQETAERHASDTESLFKSVLADLANRIERQKVRIAIVVAPEAAVVQVDAIKMHDALRNLVENAVNYSPEGGRIDLAARAEGDQILLTVADQGPGLPEAELSRVFERFYRVDKSRTRDPGGTGLGLSIVRHLIEIHGGRVLAANRPEGGAIFTIELPQGKKG